MKPKYSYSIGERILLDIIGNREFYDPYSVSIDLKCSSSSIVNMIEHLEKEGCIERHKREILLTEIGEKLRLPKDVINLQIGDHEEFELAEKYIYTWEDKLYIPTDISIFDNS